MSHPAWMHADSQLKDLYMLQMPMDGVPRDPLRDGLYAHKDVSRVTHPVENILRESDTSARKNLQEQVYGTALPARAVIEHQILNRYEL